MRMFSNTEKKVSVFENIRIHVDGGVLVLSQTRVSTSQIIVFFFFTMCCSSVKGHLTLTSLCCLLYERDLCDSPPDFNQSLSFCSLTVKVAKMLWFFSYGTILFLWSGGSWIVPSLLDCRPALGVEPLLYMLLLVTDLVTSPLTVSGRLASNCL